MTLIKRLKDIKKKEEFEPGFLGLFINPFYFARKGLFKNIFSFKSFISGRVLDVGCGKKPYYHLFTTTEYIGMDIEQSGHPHINEQIDVFYDGKTFPFVDHSFDNLICNQVLEHVFNPDTFLREINRVLKPEGYLLLTVPFVWDEHEKPYDYARYSSFGLTHLLKNHSFEIVEFRKSMSDIRVIFQLINTYLFKITETRSGIVNLFMVIIFMAPFNILGEILGLILPSNKDFYLDNIVLARKKKANA